MMPAFSGLSYPDKWRVTMCLRRGETPGDPRLAAAAVDLAEGYRREGRVKAALLPLYVLLTLVWFGYLSISGADGGDQWMLILFALAVPLGIAILLLDPRHRRKNVARSLEASRRFLASSGWGLGSTAQPADADDSAFAAGWYRDPHNNARERLWDGEGWTSWVRPIREGRVETDPAGWQPHPSQPGKEMLWSGTGWTDRERDSADLEG